MFRQIKTIFFDFDGTLNDSITLYAPAFRMGYQVLVEAGAAEDRVWTDLEIAYWLGFSSTEMWARFMPNLDPKLRDEASKTIGREMLRGIDEGKTTLYKGALDILKYLKTKDYTLVFISNCSISYMEKMTQYFDLDYYFTDMVCSQQYENQPKYVILSQIKDKFPSGQVIVGDRMQDVEAGKKNGILTIGCSYGYGSEEELRDTDWRIQSIGELQYVL